MKDYCDEKKARVVFKKGEGEMYQAHIYMPQTYAKLVDAYHDDLAREVERAWRYRGPEKRRKARSGWLHALSTWLAARKPRVRLEATSQAGACTE
jgi:hypothetical protein